MGRKAMHEKCVFAGFRQELFIDLIWLKNLQALGQFTLLTHARPDVGVNRVRTNHVVRRRGPLHVFARRGAVFLGTDHAKS